MTEQSKLTLQSSEKAVLQASAHIFGSYIIANKVTEANEEELLNKSVELGIKMALKTDQLISSDDEISSKLGQIKTVKPPSF